MGSDQKANYTQMEEELELEQYGVWVKTGPEEIPLDDSDLGTENFDLEDLDIPEESSISDISEEEEQLLDDLQFEDDGGLEEEELTPSEALEADQEEVFDLDLDFDESLNLEEDSSLPNHIDDLEDDPFSLDSFESIAQEPEEIPAAEIMDSDFGDFEELSLEEEEEEGSDVPDVSATAAVEEKEEEESADFDESFSVDSIEDIDLDQLDLEAEAILAESDDMPLTVEADTLSMDENALVTDEPFPDIDDITMEDMDSPASDIDSEPAILEFDSESDLDELDIESLDQEDFGEDLTELEEVELDEEKEDLPEFDDLSAFEEDLSSEDSAQEEQITLEPDSEPLTSGEEDEADGSVLSKIEKELLTIKDELTSLRQELSVLRSKDALQSGDVPFREIESMADDSEPQNEEEAGFFEDDEDETIALTGDELDNILNTADITEETGTEFEKESVLEEAAETSDTTDADMDHYGFPEIDLEIDQEPATPAELEPELLDDSDSEDSIELLQEEEEEEEEEEIEILQDEELTEDESDSPEATISEDEDIDFGIEEIDLDQELSDLSELDSLDDEEIDIEMDSDESPASNENIVSEIEPEQLDQDDDDLDIDLLDLDEPEELDIEEIQEVDVPDLMADEDLLVDKADILPMQEEEEIYEADESDVELNSDDPEVSEPSGSFPIDMELPEMQDDECTDSEEIPQQLREEIKSVLSYMDHLLESLPDEKIEEFANSEHFEVYKRLFSELGLST